MALGVASSVHRGLWSANGTERIPDPLTDVLPDGAFGELRALYRPRTND